MSKQLTIALDFDDTFTADPKLWSMFVDAATMLGHKVIMVTARRNTEENVDLINEHLDNWSCQMPVYFTCLGSKVEAMIKRKIEVDIWIDDSPMTLVRGH